MAAKKTTKQVATPVTKAIPAVAKTEVRNSPLPKPAIAKPVAAKPREITHEMIQRRAYEIWQREGGNEYENWCRAERELRGA